MAHGWKEKTVTFRKMGEKKQFHNGTKVIKFRLGLKHTKQNKTLLCLFFSLCQLFDLDILKLSITKFLS